MFMLKDHASRRAVSENAAILVGQPALGRTDTAPATNDLALGLDQAGLRRDRPNKRNLELERGLRKALVQHGLNSKPHAAIEQRRSKTSVNGAGGIAMPSCGIAAATTRPLETSTMS